MRFTSGVIVVIAGGLVNWISKLQPVVAVSSMEAEHCLLLLRTGYCVDPPTAEGPWLGADSTHSNPH
jgi:hypothetical protein